jgi:hypothetical protein
MGDRPEKIKNPAVKFFKFRLFYPVLTSGLLYDEFAVGIDSN